MAQPVIVVSEGYSRQCGGNIIELYGTNITGDTVQMGVSADPLVRPTSWSAPTTLLSISPSVIHVMLLLDNTYAPGVYWLWVQITDGQDKEPIPFPEPYRLI